MIDVPTEKKPKISVIVPVYNVAKYLDQCLESIVNQTLKEIEIIIINDGSTDNSLDIINKYAELDSRILVVTQENGGYAKAVNKGLSMATGEYIAEVDSDDYLNKNMYKKLYEIAIKDEVDIVVGRYAEFAGKDSTFKMFPKSFVSEKYQNVKLSTSKIYEENNLELLGFTAIWSAIYKRTLITENNITLNEKVRCYNDNGFWFRTRAVCKSIYYDDEIMYFYRIDVAGQTIKKMNERYPVLINEFLDIKNQFQKMGIWEENSNFWFKHLVNNVLFFVMPKIEVATMKPFVESVKPHLSEFLKKDKLLPKTLDNYANSLLNILMNRGVDAFINRYLKNKYKVSVIMAVYNGAPYLDKTIPQILDQSLSDIEFIMVNDGSTDSSLQIMEKYQYDFRLKIVNLEKNVGQSRARNIGFQHAIGEYVIFLDCDDDFNHELVGKLYWHMNHYKLDVCLSGYSVHNCKTGNEYSNLFYSFPNEVFDGSSLSSNNFNQIVGWNWDKMYRKSFITKNKIFFPEDMHISEDALVAYPAVLLAKRAFVVKESLITYKEYGSNSVSSKMDKYVADNFKYYEKMYAFIKENGLEKTHEKHFINLFVGHTMFAFDNLLKTEKAREEFFDLLVGTYIDKFRISNKMPTYYFDNDSIVDRYKKIRRMMKYKPGEYDLFVSDLEKIPLEIDDFKFGSDYTRDNIVVIKPQETKKYSKWIYAFDSGAKKADVNWVNILNVYLLKGMYQDNYLSFTVNLLKNNSHFISDKLDIAITSLNNEYNISMFNWEKNNKLNVLIAYTLNNEVLKIYAKFTGAYDGISIITNLVESRSNELPIVDFYNKQFLTPDDFIKEPDDLKFALNAPCLKSNRKKKKKNRKPSVIRFLLNKDNRRKLMNKLMAFVKN